MNARDSERMAALLETMGYEPAANGDDADVVVVNTCSVREKPEHKVYSELGRYADNKRYREDMVLVVAGCVAQQGAEELLRRVGHLDIVIGTRELWKLPQLVEEVLNTGKRFCATEMKDADLGRLFGAERPPVSGGPTAFVVAMTGCSNFCSYCVVPRLRGPAISRPRKDILDEVRELAAAGVREVTLLGQNVNIYGEEFGGAAPDFPELLKEVSEVEGIVRVRFVTSHPKDFSDKLIREIADNSKICEYIHLPAQAGSNSVLEAMRRGYTVERYMELTEKIRAAIPDAALSSDFIVGFPGETEEDFEETLDLVRQVRYHNIYSFRYSVRPHTRAAKMSPAIPVEERARRLKKLQGIQNEITESIMKSYEGKAAEVLMEGPSKTDPNRTTGRTGSNLPVHVTGKFEPGRLVEIRITRALRHSLEGEVVP